MHPEPDVGLRRLVLSDGPAGVRGERWDERDPIWEYLDAQVMPEANGDVMVKVRVRNTGARLGREEETISEVAIPARTFAHSDSGSRAWTVEPGTLQLHVGRSSHDLPICADVAFPATAGTSPLGPG